MILEKLEYLGRIGTSAASMQLKDASFDELVDLETAGQLADEVNAFLPTTRTDEGTQNVDLKYIVILLYFYLHCFHSFFLIRHAISFILFILGKNQRKVV